MPYDTEVSTTATVFDTEDDNGIWTFADLTGDGSLDLARTANTPTAFDAVDEHPAASGHTFLLRDWTGDGRADLILVKTRDTPGGKVELHVAAADADYQAYALQTETVFDCEDGGAWTMTYPRGDHLVYLKTRDCGSGMVEVHTAGRGGGGPSDRGEPTAFEAEENGTWCLAPRGVDDGEGGGGLADLYYVKTRETDSGVVEVHAATAESGWQDRPLGIVSSFAPGEDGHWVLADLNGGDVPDLVYVKVRDTDSGKVEIHTNEV
uniref:Fg-gap repeat protein n=1 Tax=Colletotrichum fructicola (strain Nara gc5) TaxID=1213859 RepID=L2G3K2_COLFN